MHQLTDLQQLSVDLYNGTVTEYTAKEAEAKLRNMLLEKVGGTFNYWNFEKNKVEIFQIMSELLTVTTSELTRETFAPFAEFRDIALGDITEFEVENEALYEVAIVATDNNNLRRQRLMGKKVQMTSTEVGVKIYETFAAFMAGRIDWVKTVNKVALSIERDVVKRVGQAFVSAYTAAHANLKVSGAMDEAKLVELVAKVEAQTGTTATIYGSKVALAKIPGLTGYDPDNASKKANGYVKNFTGGTQCVEIQNTYDKTSNTWGIATDKLFVVPSGVKPIMVAFEGEGYVFEGKGERLDRQLEYLFTRRMQIGVVRAVNYGVYTIA